MERHSDDEKYPLNAMRALTTKQREEARRAQLKGVKTYQLEVALLTQSSKIDNANNQRLNAVNAAIKIP